LTYVQIIQRRDSGKLMSAKTANVAARDRSSLFISSLCKCLCVLRLMVSESCLIDRDDADVYMGKTRTRTQYDGKYHLASAILIGLQSRRQRSVRAGPEDASGFTSQFRTSSHGCGTCGASTRPSPLFLDEVCSLCSSAAQ
jgi:hypothetical protein